MNIKIANKLTELRKAKGLSQEELAEKLNVSRQTISNWERCESSPDIDNFVELSKLYEISIDELLCCKEEKKEPLYEELSIKKEENKKILFNVLLVTICFLCPIIGIVLFFVSKKKENKRYSAYSSAISVALIISVVSTILMCKINDKVADIKIEGFTFAYHKEFTDFKGDIPDLYEDTKDNVLEHHQYPKFESIKFDAKTDSLIFKINNFKIDVYDYKTAQLKYTFIDTAVISDYFVYNGKLGVSYAKNATRVNMYDLSNGECEEHIFSFPTTEIGFTDDYLIICDGYDQHGYIYKYDFKTKTTKTLGYDMYQASMDFNPEDELIYAVEKGVSDCEFRYYDLKKDSYELYNNYDIRYSYNEKDVYFDGFYVHAFGKTFRKDKGVLVAQNDVTEYVDNNNFILEKTLYSDYKLSIIACKFTKTVIYSKETEYLVYGMQLNATSMFKDDNVTFIAGCADNQHVAILHLDRI